MIEVYNSPKSLFTATKEGRISAVTECVRCSCSILDKVGASSRKSQYHWKTNTTF